VQSRGELVQKDKKPEWEEGEDGILSGDGFRRRLLGHMLSVTQVRTFRRKLADDLLVKVYLVVVLTGAPNGQAYHHLSFPAPG
jgi:hypothetical protein